MERIEDESRNLTYEIEKVEDALFHATCTSYPQFVYTGPTFAYVAHSVRYWTAQRQDDERFYNLKSARAVELSNKRHV